MSKSFVRYLNESGWIATVEEVKHAQEGHKGKLEECSICFPQNR